MYFVCCRNRVNSRYIAFGFCQAFFCILLALRQTDMRDLANDELSFFILSIKYSVRQLIVVAAQCENKMNE